MSLTRLGKKHTEETKQKMSLSSLNNKESIKRRTDILLKQREEKYNKLFNLKKENIMKNYNLGYTYKENKKRIDITGYMFKKMIKDLCIYN